MFSKCFSFMYIVLEKKKLVALWFVVMVNSSTLQLLQSQVGEIQSQHTKVLTQSENLINQELLRRFDSPTRDRNYGDFFHKDIYIVVVPL